VKRLNVLFQHFAQMLRDRRGEELDQWLHAAFSEACMAEQILICFGYGFCIIESVPEPVTWVHSRVFCGNNSGWLKRALHTTDNTSLIDGAVTRTSSSSGVSLIEVIASACGKGNSVVLGIPCHLLQ
jgi:hypothetical protein